jgi:hypothetical protein
MKRTDPIDWNTQPREAVERAAADGDLLAQSALRITHRLDRLEANAAATRQVMRQLDESVDALIALSSKRRP